MEAKLPEITLGEYICETLKRIYCPETCWGECHKDIAQRFTELKNKARKFYVDKSEIEILQELCRYRADNIEEMMSM